MSLKDSFFSRHKIICIIFQHRCSFCIFHAFCHDLHDTNHSCCLPVSFSSKSISLLHQTLDRKSRKLFECTEISKMCNDCLIVFLLKETLESKLDLCLNSNMFSELFRISSFKKDLIFVIILFY